MIRAHLASYPPREEMLRQMLPSILPQVDRVFLCLNEYGSVPGWIAENDKIEAIIPDQDHKDVGKFVTRPADDDVVFFVDDDVKYHPRYVRRMVKIARQIGMDGNAFGYHGSTYKPSIVQGRLERRIFQFQKRLTATTEVHQLATNSMMAVGKNVAPLEYMLDSQKFVDVRYAKWLFEQGVKSWSVRRDHGFLKEISPTEEDHETIWESFTKNTPVHVIREIQSFTCAEEADNGLRAVG